MNWKALEAWTPGKIVSIWGTLKPPRSPCHSVFYQLSVSPCLEGSIQQSHTIFDWLYTFALNLIIIIMLWLQLVLPISSFQVKAGFGGAQLFYGHLTLCWTFDLQ